MKALVIAEGPRDQPTLVSSMGPDELADFEERSFRQWDRASQRVVRIAIDRRPRDFDG